MKKFNKQLKTCKKVTDAQLDTLSNNNKNTTI